MILNSEIFSVNQAARVLSNSTGSPIYIENQTVDALSMANYKKSLTNERAGSYSIRIFNSSFIETNNLFSEL